MAGTRGIDRQQPTELAFSVRLVAALALLHILGHVPQDPFVRSTDIWPIHPTDISHRRGNQARAFPIDIQSVNEAPPSIHVAVWP
jgi:hypothetical protein